MLADKLKEARKAYIAEFSKTKNEQGQEDLVFQFFVDMCKLGLEPSSAVEILAIGDDAIFKHPAVERNLHSRCIHYIKQLNVPDIYKAAEVPIERDFSENKDVIPS